MKNSTAPSTPYFFTRGVVIHPNDLSLRDWPERAANARLTTIALHDGRSCKVVSRFIASENGQRFLESCRRLGLAVEYELHAMSDLLPRELFAKDPTLFRMNEKGERTPDCNFCAHSERALEIIAENAVALARELRPTTGRYFLWGDDGKPYCRCPQCAGLSDSDQALILENRLVQALRRADEKAQVAHLAYAQTYQPPKQIKPAPGVFLEFAPIHRKYNCSLAETRDPEQRKFLELLDANLRVFGAESAQALEYWLDVSKFSRWKRPAVKLPWNREVFAADLNLYASRGVRHITSFAVFMDAEYVARYGEPPLREYGEELLWTWAAR